MPEDFTVVALFPARHDYEQERNLFGVVVMPDEGIN